MSTASQEESRRRSDHSGPDAEIRRELAELRAEMEALREEVTSNYGKSDLLTREEAANWLRISTRTLDDMAEAGEIKPVRVRGRVLYHVDTLEAYIRREKSN